MFFGGLLIFFKLHFQKVLSGISSECQTAWIQIRPNHVQPDLVPNCLQMLSADETSRQRVKVPLCSR